MPSRLVRSISPFDGVRSSVAVTLRKVTATGTAVVTQSPDNVHRLYKPLLRAALADWQDDKLYLSLDTSLFWIEQLESPKVGHSVSIGSG